MDKELFAIDKGEVLLITIALTHYIEYLRNDCELPDFICEILEDNSFYLIDKFDNLVQSNS